MEKYWILLIFNNKEWSKDLVNTCLILFPDSGKDKIKLKNQKRIFRLQKSNGIIFLN